MSVSYDETLPPGAEGKLQIEVDTSRLSGRVDRRVTLFTNDEENEQTPVRVRGEVLVSVQLMPNDWIFLNNATEKTRYPSLVVRKDPREEGELVIDGLQLSAPWLTATARQAEEPEIIGPGLPALPGDWVIQLGYDGVPDYGRSAQTLRFQTGLSFEPEIEVPIRARIEPAFRFERNLILKQQPHGGAKGNLAVRVRTDLDRLELQAEGRPDDIEIELQPTRRTEMLVNAEWDADSGSLGKIVLWIGDEAMEMQVEVQD